MLPTYFKNLSLEKKVKFMKNIDTLVFDCDGVLWLGGVPVEGAIDVVNLFQEKGRRVCFVSNNSTKTLDQYRKKFDNLGFKCSEDCIFITAPLVADYVKNNMDNSKSVYLLGSNALSSELTKRGIKHFGHDHQETVASPEELSVSEIEEKLPLDENVGAVVVAYDYHFNYTKMILVCSYLRNPDCLFIGSNIDSVFPHPNKKYVLPGTGVGIAAAEFGTGRQAVLLGKPHQFIVDILKKKHVVDPKKTLFIGDRCNTDILFGNRAGFSTMLVLSGVHNLEHIKEYAKSDKKDDKMSVPNYYTDSVKDLVPVLQAIFDS